MTSVLDDASVDLLGVLAEPTRATIVRALAREELCTCHLVELTGARQTNVSNHLRVLREAGAVEGEQAGRYTYYRLVPEAIEQVAGLLSGLAREARTTASRSTTMRRRACD